MTITVRKRSRDILRTEIAESVYDYFAVHGFDESTVDDTAQGVGISRATFFRYFGSKEEAVLVAVDSSALSFADAFRQANLPSGCSAWEAIRSALEPSISMAQADSNRVQARIRMIHATPTLRARLAERRIVQRDALVDAVAQRIDRPTATMLCAAALGILDIAWSEWASDPTIPLRKFLDAGFERLSTVSQITLSTTPCPPE